MKWLPLLLASALPALAQGPPMPPGITNDDHVVKLVSPKYSEHVTSLAKSFHVRQVKPLGSAHLIVYTPTTKTKSLAIPGAKGIVPFAVTLPTITLTWDYPADQITNVVFEVWFSTELFAGPPLATYDAIPTGFTLSMTVDGPPVKIQTNLPQQFFIVRAKDRATGVVSPWNVALNSQGPVNLIAPEDGQMVSNTIALIAVISLPLNAPWSPGRLTLKL